MGRTTNITFGQVAAIADAMKAAGTRPTARAVRERIGTGSMGTIHKLLQQWAGKVAEADEEDDSPELPSSIASTLMDFVSTQVAEACEPLNEELQAAKDAANQIAEDNERMHLAFDEQGRELVNMLEQANDLAERLKTCENRADRQTEELKHANNDYQVCAARLEAAAREIESLKAAKAKTPTKPKPAKTLQTKSKETQTQ